MAKITEREFAKLCVELQSDRDVIIKHNQIGSDEEILLWMLLSVLHSYLSLTEQETPCFSGKPDADVYRESISFVLKDKKADEFDENGYLDRFRTKD